MIEGTRVLVSTILGALSGGDSIEMVCEDYQLTTSQIRSAFEFASSITDFQTISYEGVA